MPKYKYNGVSESEVPLIGKIVKPGDIIETDKEINNPDFELLEQEVQAE